MVILITGASHTGKTLLAQRMLEKYKYPYLSIDHLKMGLIRSGCTKLTPEDENGQNLIVEGCYIPFEWRKDFDARYLPSLRFICLAMTDAYIDAHFAEIREHGSDIEARLDDSGCTADGLKRDNREIIEGYHNAGEPVVLIGADYERTTAELLK